MPPAADVRGEWCYVTTAVWISLLWMRWLAESGAIGMVGLHIEAGRAGDTIVLRVVGCLDLGTRGWLADFVDGVLPGSAKVVVDLGGVALCDAASMSTLIGIADVCRARGGWLRLAAPTGLVARVFAVVAFGKTVPVYATVAAAVAGDELQRIKD
jgi:anti-sigma B factor antagonist